MPRLGYGQVLIWFFAGCFLSVLWEGNAESAARAKPWGVSESLRSNRNIPWEPMRESWKLFAHISTCIEPMGGRGKVMRYRGSWCSCIILIRNRSKQKDTFSIRCSEPSEDLGYLDSPEASAIHKPDQTFPKVQVPRQRWHQHNVAWLREKAIALWHAPSRI